MSGNKPFSTASACSCGVGSGPDMLRFGGKPDPGSGYWYWSQSDPGSATNACGNVAHSPIDCQDCCAETVDVLPPYVPGPADLALTPSCTSV